MSRFIDITPGARKDIRRILRLLDGRSPRGALAWYKAFWDAALLIAENPERFPLGEEHHRVARLVRDALFKTRRGRRYRIVFEFTPADVIILRVRQPGQRPLRRRDLPD